MKMFYSAEQMFRALGDHHRLSILEQILEREMNAGELLETVDVVQSTLSHHMKILCSSGLVHARRAGKCTFYTINREAMDEACRVLSNFGGRTPEIRNDVQAVSVQAASVQAASVQAASAQAEPVLRTQKMIGKETPEKTGDQEKVRAKDRNREKDRAKDRAKDRTKERTKDRPKDRLKDKTKDRTKDKEKDRDRDKVKIKSRGSKKKTGR